MGNSLHKSVPDLCALGREKFASSSLATFNKKVCELIEGKGMADELDDLLLPNFEIVLEPDNEDYCKLNDTV
jgi:hypothetical protein